MPPPDQPNAKNQHVQSIREMLEGVTADDFQDLENRFIE